MNSDKKTVCHRKGKGGKKTSGKNSSRTWRGRLETNSADEAPRFSLNTAEALPKVKHLPSYHTRAQHATCEQPVKAFKQAGWFAVVL